MAQELRKLAEEIKHLDYVVQRNWDGLPDDMGGDLDIFVSNKDFPELSLIADKYWPELIDIRQPGDGYYPQEIEVELLKDVRFHHGFKIPSKRAHFLSLYYHNAVHKDHKYDEYLRDCFLTCFNPTRPEDKGVNYNGNYRTTS